MGDACEMLVAAELTLAGIPASKMPDGWPGYDVVAQPPDVSIPPQRISVKARTFKRGGDTFVVYSNRDVFDWLAIVLLPGDNLAERRFFLIPRTHADEVARRDSEESRTADQRYWRQDQVPTLCARFERNFRLLTDPPR